MSDPNAWMGPTVTAALVTSIVSLVAAITNTATILLTHGKRLQLERELAKQKADSEVALARMKSKSDISLAKRKFALDRDLAGAKLRLDQALADWKRRTDLAEQVLADFYKARDAFLYSRVYFSGEGNGKTRKRAENETKEEAEWKDNVYANFERLSKHLDFLSELDARRHKFAALFGQQALLPFNIISTSYSRVKLATSFLMDDYRPKHMDADTRLRYKADIGWGDDANDRIRKDIDNAVAQIEAICRPVLESKAP